jgi:hypothetical protein
MSAPMLDPKTNAGWLVSADRSRLASSLCTAMPGGCAGSAAVLRDSPRRS